MTEKNQKHCFDLYNWLKECAHKKPKQFTTFDKHVFNELSRDRDAFNVLVSLSNDKIKDHFESINALKKLITSKIQESKDPQVKKTLEIAKNFDTTGKNICTELQELIANPEETFKDENKVWDIIELNSNLIDSCKEFKDYTLEVCEKAIEYIRNPENFARIIGDDPEENLESSKPKETH